MMSKPAHLPTQTYTFQPNPPLRSIYPTIPDPGTDPATIQACLVATKQVVSMIIANSQAPVGAFAPQTLAQVFVTHGDVDPLTLRVLRLENSLKAANITLVTLE